ncbi:MAG: hypothetical protein Kow0010_09990 [Dehalococcoidia bacterium]
MPRTAVDEVPAGIEWSRITWRLAQVLRELADGCSLGETAERLGISYNGIRSDVGKLKDITGLRSVRDIGRWWRDEGSIAWGLAMLEAAGVDPRNLAS